MRAWKTVLLLALALGLAFSLTVVMSCGDDSDDDDSADDDDTDDDGEFTCEDAYGIIYDECDLTVGGSSKEQAIENCEKWQGGDSDYNLYGCAWECAIMWESAEDCQNVENCINSCV